ncbi:retinol-binding protein pinta-like isoform X3 [Schistocerca piceifrons]|uniref:retinol-binding protein pinta-like isoform X3 n=1 Tax=Schistocerca piceifrons TaxID=274613 RepID=UPI001F5FBFD6|nr:retinol-binding protein pinta-like isoform X3 [Schistocerca piceifrons]
MSDRYSFIPATREQMETIRKKLGTDEEGIKRTIASVRDWLRMQPHLPDEIDDARIERMYLNCKCSVERVKKGLDAYFSLRTRYPEMMMNRDPMGTDIVSTMDHIVMLTMPRLTKELYRVHIFADPDPDPMWVSWTNYRKTVSITLDWMLLNDYSLGDVVVMDLKNTTAGHVLRSDINMIRAIEFGYKIHVHPPESMTLFDHVAKEHLPDELGGTGGPMDKLAYDFFRRTEKMRDWFLEQDRYISDESKRPPDNHYADDLFGIAGSFKKLSVD